MSSSIPHVYSRRLGATPPPPDAVYVGRGTPWGNPFRCEVESDDPRQLHGRTWACNEFEKYATERIKRDPHWLDTLRGKDLVCWCAPKRCHADTLLRLANRSRVDEEGD